MEKATHTVIDAAGLSMSVVAGNIDPNDISTAVQIIVQIIIGVATLWGLFKKKKTA